MTKTIFYNLIGYYKGPERKKSMLDFIFRGQGTFVYYVNPQLYRIGNPHLLEDFGVYTIKFGSSIPSQSELETRIKRELHLALKDEINITSPQSAMTISAEEIKISLEKEEE